MVNIVAILTASILSLLSLVTIGWEARYWIPPMSKREKISRSLYTGISVMVLLPSALSVVDLTSAPNAIENWSLSSFLLLLCLGLPFGLVAILGTYMRFTVLDSIRKK